MRYMTPRQWKYRFYYTIRNRLKRKPVFSKEKIIPSLFSGCYKLNNDSKNVIVVADKILENIIPSVSGTFINYNGDWDLGGEKYRLMSFRLNSFRWLLDLSDSFKMTGNIKYINKGFEMIRDWQLKNTSFITGDKWNPYVVAERITNWVEFCSEYCNQDEIIEYAPWIYTQAHELLSSIEYHLGGNHLLSEAKALVLAGYFLKNKTFYDTGKQLLVDESKEQFYQDGGHCEQSISYHVESLQQYFETFTVVKQAGDDPTTLVECMRKPYQFLNGMIGANGKIPLFNDSAYDYPFYDAADFLSTAKYIFTSPPNGKTGEYSKRWAWLGDGTKTIDWNTKNLYEDTGFIHYPFQVDERKYSFFMDCGNNGPDYNLGHAHADALSILLYSEEKDILVDSGVFTYQPGEERNECRSTKAHNTVEIDGKNNAEVWSAFRTAKRGHTKIIDFSSEDGLWVKAVYDGYKVILNSPVFHTRTVNIHQGMIEINDTVESPKKRNAVSRWHISPDCTVTLLDQYSCLIDGITMVSEKEIRINECKIAAMFGITQKAKCLEIEFTGNLKTKFKLLKDKN